MSLIISNHQKFKERNKVFMGHTTQYHQLMSHLRERYNMFGDELGGVDPKGINGAKITMYYNITSPKNIASHQSNYKSSV